MKIRVLNVEDSQDDTELLRLELARSGYDAEVLRVEKPAEMRAALERAHWDVIISDYSMPEFSAPDAFQLLKASGLDIPFIIVSGTMGEETAVAAMKLGVQDYLLKGNLRRLAPAIERELREWEGRKARRKAEEELRKSEERYRALFEAMPVPMLVHHIETQAILAVNEASIRHYGYSREEFERMTLGMLQPRDDQGEELDRHEYQAAAEGALTRHVTKDGSIIVVELRSHDLEFQGACARLLAVNDVTRRLRAEQALRRTEEQLRHAQKMEAIGSLAGGVAHDFNNLLTVILSYTNMAMAGVGPDDPIRADLEQVNQAGERAADLTRQLLAFSRKQVLAPRVLDLSSVVLGLENMLRRLLGEHIELSLRARPLLGNIQADPGQLEQVVMNLVVNARDAMPRGGKLAIETSDAVLDSGWTDEHVGVAPGPYVMLAVSDTGVGMDRATQSRIFEPFFTTKERGKGTGLGLSTVYGIVKQSGGHIEVSSEPGKGTTFRVYFPLTDRVDDAELPAPSTSKRLLGSETILLVEDQAQVRMAMSSILRRYGYRVLEAENAEAALRTGEQLREPIHLLITDVVMPRMTGPELAERFAKLRPDAKVFYVSGYAESTVLHDGVLRSGAAFLQKPITPEALALKVREVLDHAVR